MKPVSVRKLVNKAYFFILFLLISCGGGSEKPNSPPGNGGGKPGSTCSKSFSAPESFSEGLLSDGGNAISLTTTSNALGEALMVWVQETAPSSGEYALYKSEYKDCEWIHPSSTSDYFYKTSYSIGEDDLMARLGTEDAVIVFVEHRSSVDRRLYYIEKRNGAWLDLNLNKLNKNNAAFNAQLAVNKGGEALIVWRERYAENDFRIYMSEYKGGVWSHPTDPEDHISPYNEDYTEDQAASYPEVALSENGNAVVSWIQSKDPAVDDSAIYLSHYQDGVWVHPNFEESFYESSTSIITPAKLKINDTGEALMAWVDEYEEGIYQVFTAEYANANWSLLDKVGNMPQSNFQIEINNKGQSAISWQQLDSNYSSFHTFVSMKNKGESLWSTPMQVSLSDSDSNQYLGLELALNNLGRLVVSWIQSGSNFKTNVYFAEYFSGVWDLPQSLEDHISLPNNSNSDVKIWSANLNDNNDLLFGFTQFNEDRGVTQVYRVQGSGSEVQAKIYNEINYTKSRK